MFVVAFWKRVVDVAEMSNRLGTGKPVQQWPYKSLLARAIMLSPCEIVQKGWLWASCGVPDGYMFKALPKQTSLHGSYHPSLGRLGLHNVCLFKKRETKKSALKVIETLVSFLFDSCTEYVVCGKKWRVLYALGPFDAVALDQKRIAAPLPTQSLENRSSSR